MIQKNKDCRKCVYFRPHDIFDYFGLCLYKNELKIKTSFMETCDEFKEVNLEDLRNIIRSKGWLYCNTCRKAIYTVEELIEHIEDELGAALFSDVVASEEAPTAS